MNRIEKGAEVTLTAVEIALAKQIAEEKYKISRKGGLKYGERLNAQDENRMQNEVLGICGELAFCRLANVYPDLDVTQYGKDEDCRTRTGKTIDVKTTSRAGRAVWANADKKSYCDYFVLMKAGSPEDDGGIQVFTSYTFKGYCHRDELVRPANLKTGSSGRSAYWLEEEMLSIPW